MNHHQPVTAESHSSIPCTYMIHCSYYDIPARLFDILRFDVTSQLQHTHIRLFSFFTAHPNRFLYIFLQYYSVICRPSDHTVGRPPRPGPRFEPGTGDLEAGTLITRPPQFHTFIYIHCFKEIEIYIFPLEHQMRVH